MVKTRKQRMDEFIEKREGILNARMRLIAKGEKYILMNQEKMDEIEYRKTHPYPEVKNKREI